MHPPATFRHVKLLPLFAVVALLAGCQTPYTKLTVTDHQGDRIAEWIAEGPVKKTEQGYGIKAVERTSRAPHAITNRYPNGWHTQVIGPNIVRQRVDKPLWLAEMDGEVIIQTETGFAK